MKKILTLVFIIIIMVSTLNGCANKENDNIEVYKMNFGSGTYTSDKKLEPAEEILSCDVDEYIMDLTLDTKKNSLSGEVIMNITNRSGNRLDALCIRNYASSIFEKQKSGKSVIEKVSITESEENLLFNTKEDSSVIYVNLDNHVLNTGSSISIKVQFYLDIPNQEDRLGYVKEGDRAIYQLSYCFPTLAMYENGNWNENPYLDGSEALFHKVSDFYVTLNVPEDYLVAATGTEKNKGNTIFIEGKNIREFAMVASNYMEVETQNIDGVNINNYILDYKGLEDYYNYSIEAAKDSMQLYTEVFGKYPYEELDIVPTFIPSAIEYPGLMMIGFPDVKSIEEIGEYGSYFDLCSKVAHEVAHQWFYATIGNDQFSEPWLDESFAEYCEQILYAYSGKDSVTNSITSDYKRLGVDNGLSTSEKDFKNRWEETKFDQCSGVKINMPRDYYVGEDKNYSSIVYQEGASFLYALQNAMGEDEFFYMMKEYYQTYYLKEVKGEDFLKAVRLFSSSKEVENIIHKFIDET